MAHPDDPRLRLHHAAVSVLAIYLSTKGSEKTSTKTSLPKLIAVYNSKYLNRLGDKKLCVKTLRRCLKKMSEQQRLQYLYFHQMKTKQHGLQMQIPSHQKNRDQFGEDASKIRKQIEIHQCTEPILYSCPKLHERPHGSAPEMYLRRSRATMEKHGIENAVISKSMAGDSGVVKEDDVVVAFDHSRIIIAINMTMRGGIEQFRQSLFTFMMSRDKTDTARVKKLSTGQPATNLRARFGYNQIQRPTHHSHWSLEGERMPSYNVYDFLDMDEDLRYNMMKLAEGGQRFLCDHYRSAGRDLNRIKHCVKRLNEAMGFPQSTSRFEYFDIVLTQNTLLEKHMDYKNDNREGYDHCVVYSFFYGTFRIAVIMTTRRDIGAALDRALSAK